jgi:superfamily II DNA or RNA helicase
MSTKEQYYTVIYWYTTPLKKAVGRVKNGSTRRLATSPMAAAIMRVKEQMTAKDSDDPWEILHVEDISDECETGQTNKSLSLLRLYEQRYLHKKQKDAGMWHPAKSPKSEWYEDPELKSVDYVVDFGKRLVNERRYGSSRPNSFKMRGEQRECRNKAMKHFNSGGDQFLVNAKMRYGKTFTTYQIAKAMKAKKVLVLTYKPQVEFGWAEDLSTHVDFEGWDYYYAKDFTSDETVVLPGTAKTEVLFASFQDLNDMTKSKWSEIASYDFDILVIDEQHYGSASPRAQRTLDALSYKHTIEVSGTPLYALMSGKFLDHEVYTWSYADEQRKKRAEEAAGWVTEIYRWLPTMKFMVLDISEAAKNLASHYSDNEGFTMQKMFGSNDGITFIDEGAVSMWLEEAYGVTGHKNKSPVRQHNPDHMVWKLPSVDACRAMEKLLSTKEYVKHMPIVVSGTDGANLENTKNHIRRFDKTVTLTCGSLMTGTTIPEWTLIFMLDGGSSPQDYFQSIFRVQSSHKAARKEVCHVVDYNPERNLQMIYEYSFVMALRNGKSTREEIADFLDFAPVLDHTGNTPVLRDVEHILDAVAHTSNSIEKFGSIANFQFGNVTEDTIASLLGVEADVNSKREVTVNENGIAKGLNHMSRGGEGKEQPEVDLTVKAMRELQQKAITVIKKIPNYIWVARSSADNINDILNENNNLTFEQEVGISLTDLATMRDQGFINTTRVNLCIMAYQQTQRQLFKT